MFLLICLVLPVNVLKRTFLFQNFEAISNYLYFDQLVQQFSTNNSLFIQYKTSKESV